MLHHYDLHFREYYHVSRYNLFLCLIEMAMSQNLTWYDYKMYCTKLSKVY